MAITNITLKNFTVFDNIDIPFCQGINIIIGKNGTGKTHLLKALYASCEISKNKKITDTAKYFKSNGDMSFLFSNSKPLLLKIDMSDQPTEFSTGYSAINIFLTAKNVQVDQSLHSADKQISYEIYYPREKVDSVFIPAKEMLTHSTSLLALDRERKIPFDKTLLDIVAKAELGESKSPSHFEKILLEKISPVIDGKVIYENDTFYILKPTGEKIDFSMEADGLKKFALLWTLINNGLIRQNTILFWDEPEANINPELIPIVVEIILEFQRNGVQIFIATHSYQLARYFDVKKEKIDHLSFICLSKVNNNISFEQSNNYLDLSDNPIDKASGALYQDIIGRSIQELDYE